MDRASFVKPFQFTAAQIKALLLIHGAQDERARAFVARTEMRTMYYLDLRRMTKQRPILPPSEVRLQYGRIEKLSGRLMQEIEALDPLAGQSDVLWLLHGMRAPADFLEDLVTRLQTIQAVTHVAQSRLGSLRAGSRGRDIEVSFIAELADDHLRIYGHLPGRSRNARFERYMRRVFSYALPNDPKPRLGCARIVRAAVERVEAVRSREAAR